MDTHKIDYILGYFGHFMTKDEALAFRHYSSTYKLKHSQNKDKTRNQTRKKMFYERGWLSKEPNILSLLANGIDEFREKTAMRILKEHEKEIYFNNCPECGSLARTPKAKQCRFCKHDWH